MKKLILAAILGTVSLQMASANTLSFSSSLGAVIHFDGAGNFTFENLPGGFDFNVTNAAGLSGNIDGTYAIGGVTDIVPGILQSAPVSGLGNFTIFDGTDTLTAFVNWISIQTLGTGGGLNLLSTTVNLSSVAYTGTNTDLIALAVAPNATGNVSFQFGSAFNLDYLKANETNSISYSGQISAVPEPMTFSLMGLGLLGLGLVRRRIAK